MLPTELLLEIFSQIPISSVLSLSAASTSLRTLITGTDLLNQVMRTAVFKGPAFWILPVKTIPEEEELAEAIALEWLHSVTEKKSALAGGCKSAFQSGSFPYAAFVHACYESDSMRNRERFWRIVKQFDNLWRDYRLHGWQRDVFIH